MTPEPNVTFTRTERAADWLVGLVSPRRRALRQHWRSYGRSPEYRDFFRTLMRARGYRAAKSNARTTPWFGANQSADAEISTDLPNLRARSRELNRDDPIGSGLIRTFVNNIVGTGLRPQARTGDEAKDDALEAKWKELKDNLDRANGLTHAEHQSLLMTKVLEDGDVLIKRMKNGGTDPLWIEVVEAERLSTPSDKTGGNVRDGVEKDALGIPQTYWVSKQHPGDTFAQIITSADFIPVPAADAHHLKITERPGQSRGVPFLHATLQDLRDFDLLLLAAMKRAQIAACLAVFIKSNLPIEELIDVTAKTEGFQLDQAIEPGMIWKLGETEEIQTLIPNFPVPELKDFLIMLARRIGAALGVSWQVVLKDFGDSTFSSARTDLLETRQVYGIKRQWLAAGALTWEWVEVLTDAMQRGELPGIDPEDIPMVDWVGDVQPWIDPEKHANAIKTMLEIGATTLRDVNLEQGKDWKEQKRQQLLEEKYEMELRVEMGLPEKKADQGDKPPPGGGDGTDSDEDSEAERTLRWGAA